MNSPSLWKCWICGTPYPADGECPECGPPQPWGPTPEELAADDKRETDTPDYSDDNDYARDVCVPRWGPL